MAGIKVILYACNPAIVSAPDNGEIFALTHTFVDAVPRTNDVVELKVGPKLNQTIHVQVRYFLTGRGDGLLHVNIPPKHHATIKKTPGWSTNVQEHFKQRHG